MAKKSKSSNKAQQSPMGIPSGTKGRLDIGIEPAENGYIVRVCKEDGGKNPNYSSKRFVAATHGEAMRIAGMGIIGGKAAGGKKKGRKAKMYASKKA